MSEKRRVGPPPEPLTPSQTSKEPKREKRKATKISRAQFLQGVRDFGLGAAFSLPLGAVGALALDKAHDTASLAQARQQGRNEILSLLGQNLDNATAAVRAVRQSWEKGSIISFEHLIKDYAGPVRNLFLAQYGHHQPLPITTSLQVVHSRDELIRHAIRAGHLASESAASENFRAFTQAHDNASATIHTTTGLPADAVLDNGSLREGFDPLEFFLLLVEQQTIYAHTYSQYQRDYTHESVQAWGIREKVIHRDTGVKDKIWYRVSHAVVNLLTLGMHPTTEGVNAYDHLAAVTGEKDYAIAQAVGSLLDTAQVSYDKLAHLYFANNHVRFAGGVDLSLRNAGYPVDLGFTVAMLNFANSDEFTWEAFQQGLQELRPPQFNFDPSRMQPKPNH